MSRPNPQIYVSYDETTKDWTFGGGIGRVHHNIEVPPRDSTVTFTLTGPTGAVFTSDPIHWPEGQPACISNVQGGGTGRIQFTDSNANGAGAGGYRLKLNVQLPGTNGQPGQVVQSPDPTLINEGTGQHH